MASPQSAGKQPKKSKEALLTKLTSSSALALVVRHSANLDDPVSASSRESAQGKDERRRERKQEKKRRKQQSKGGPEGHQVAAEVKPVPAATPVTATRPEANGSPAHHVNKVEGLVRRAVYEHVDTVVAQQARGDAGVLSAKSLAAAVTAAVGATPPAAVAARYGEWARERLGQMQRRSVVDLEAVSPAQKQSKYVAYLQQMIASPASGPKPAAAVPPAEQAVPPAVKTSPRAQPSPKTRAAPPPANIDSDDEPFIARVAHGAAAAAPGGEKKTRRTRVPKAPATAHETDGVAAAPAEAAAADVASAPPQGPAGARKSRAKKQPREAPVERELLPPAAAHRTEAPRPRSTSPAAVRHVASAAVSAMVDGQLPPAVVAPVQRLAHLAIALADEMEDARAAVTLLSHRVNQVQQAVCDAVNVAHQAQARDTLAARLQHAENELAAATRQQSP